MRYEVKITLPAYKVSYAVFFAVILSLVRGVTYSYEVGIALEAPMAMLSACVLADTYTREITSNRAEVWRLCPMKKKLHFLYRRVFVQELFLLLVAAAGYGLFFLAQAPGTAGKGLGGAGSEGAQFFIYLGAVAVTVFFWGVLSNLVSCVFQNMWAGIGGCLGLWLAADSSIGDRYLGAWNLFSYTFRDVESGDFCWVYGKLACLCAGAVMLAVLPGIIRKRG